MMLQRFNLALLTIVLCLLCLERATANVMPISAGSEPLVLKRGTNKAVVPFRETAIAMEREDLTINVGQSSVGVVVRYRLHNTAGHGQHRVLGFPLAGPRGHEYRARPESFSVTCNGQRVPVTDLGYEDFVRDYQNQDYPVLGQWGYSFKVWELDFPANAILDLQVSYSQPLWNEPYYGIVGQRLFYYVLKSGALWRGGRIGSFHLAVRWDGVPPSHRDAVKFVTQPHRHHQGILQGKALSRGAVAITRSNYRPTNDLEISTTAAPGWPTRYFDNNGDRNWRLMTEARANKIAPGSDDFRSDWIMAGNLFYDRGDLRMAARCYQNALKFTGPAAQRVQVRNMLMLEDAMNAHLGLGLLAERVDQLSKALDHYQRITRAKPTPTPIPSSAELRRLAEQGVLRCGGRTSPRHR